jgi:type II secretory pathway pseudopilin PulG
MAVLSILLVVLLNVVQSAATLWRTTENRMETYREARAALQVMSSDLRNILPSTNFAFFRTNLTNTPNIGFLATLPLSSQNATSLGDVCTVGYFLKYDNKSPVATTSGRQSYNLYRYFVESNETFAKLTNASGPAAVLEFDSDFPPEILARNIVSFNATYLVTNGAGNFTTWTQNATTAMPHIVEITITAVNNERTMRFGARNAQSDWTDFSADTNASDYQKNTKTFIKRIKLNSP